jgi:hypothetical protein
VSRTTRVRRQGSTGFQSQVVVHHGAGFLHGRGTAGLHAGLPVVAGQAVDGVDHRFLFDDAEERDRQAEELSGKGHQRVEHGLDQAAQPCGLRRNETSGPAGPLVSFPQGLFYGGVSRDAPVFTETMICLSYAERGNGVTY